MFAGIKKIKVRIDVEPFGKFFRSFFADLPLIGRSELAFETK